MHLRLEKGDEAVRLESTSLGGGEAKIFLLPDQPAWAAKVYHQPTPERASKLVFMIGHPPRNPMREQGHFSVAWPVDRLLAPGTSQCVGYVMPYVRGMHPISTFYNPQARRERCPLFTYAYLLYAARNLASAVRSVHAAGYVVGDLSDANVLVHERARVTLVDADSFQIHDGKRMHRCLVGTPEFTPPELQGRTFSEVDRRVDHDNFALGVIIFHLLMEGHHPFAGRPGDPPTLAERIAAGLWPYSAGGGRACQPPVTAPPFEMIHLPIQSLFRQCFEDGRRDPARRPTATAWQHALDEAAGSLVDCRGNLQHKYRTGLPECPWCQRAKWLAGRDPFPTRLATALTRPARPRPATVPPPPAKAARVTKRVAIAALALVILGLVGAYFVTRDLRVTPEARDDSAANRGRPPAEVRSDPQLNQTPPTAKGGEPPAASPSNDPRPMTGTSVEQPKAGTAAKLDDRPSAGIPTAIPPPSPALPYGDSATAGKRNVQLGSVDQTAFPVDKLELPKSADGVPRVGFRAVVRGTVPNTERRRVYVLVNPLSNSNTQDVWWVQEAVVKDRKEFTCRCQFGEGREGIGEFFAIVVVATESTWSVGEKVEGLAKKDASFSALTIVKRE